LTKIKDDRLLYITTCNRKIVERDNLDYRLSNEILVNIMVPLVKLGGKRGYPEQIINFTEVFDEKSRKDIFYLFS